MSPVSIRRLHPMHHVNSGFRLAVVVWLCCGSIAAAAAADRPHVLLILCDDLGYSDLGCYGGEIQTPHLDQLAATGMRFTQFYNCAVCVTTRSALFTGLYPRQTKRPRLRPNMLTLGEAMRRAGYATSLTGKWHLGIADKQSPIARGFDRFYGMRNFVDSYFTVLKHTQVYLDDKIVIPGAEKPVNTLYPDLTGEEKAAIEEAGDNICEGRGPSE